MAAGAFTETFHCRSRLHCSTCRDGGDAAKRERATWASRLGLIAPDVCPFNVDPPPLPVQVTIAHRDLLDPDHPAYTGFDGSDLWAELRTFEVQEGETFPAAVARVVASIEPRLPCGTCKGHWLAMRDRTPPDDRSPLAFRRWVDGRQNEVNVLLGRDEWTEEQSDQRWGKVI